MGPAEGQIESYFDDSVFVEATPLKHFAVWSHRDRAFLRLLGSRTCAVSRNRRRVTIADAEPREIANQSATLTNIESPLKLQAIGAAGDPSRG